MKALIAPSLLSSNFAKLGEEALSIIEKGADWLHMDVMDGHFVNNLTIGAPVIRSLRQFIGEKPYLDCHLMVSDPLKWVDDFAKAGASMITFHLEAVTNIDTIINKIKEHNIEVGISIKPNTDVDLLIPYLDKIDMALVMTVEPGFGGQKFMQNMMPKVSKIRKLKPNLNIQVDGGLSLETIEIAARAGANVIVAGSAVFKSENPQKVISGLREITEKFMKQEN
ncbi:ribulose-phosphate 3-epimerase [Anaeramoeba flamelloides]|uniref:Ribulose-phosphate 3-epimerase n=1 Tax=Anaeramoeba flamelloides TaxID=1746091 RepID=A0AAV7YRL6_9EUKA|nr:ribulose-phosphate 3-epimerase [Anaeramoeba flamelloides]KAJ6238659.1 ribulose-phosphate 3-epimerase [Anaeramoeba flamelloides]|eukprot:Anaeramoba_flamelloidesa90551_93.p1 GENE.a90551_93~~a90551_93.p1  ORF type:complete len:224 (-),score=57.45 a90551_93:77-748(-)